MMRAFATVVAAFLVIVPGIMPDEASPLQTGLSIPIRSDDDSYHGPALEETPPVLTVDDNPSFRGNFNMSWSLVDGAIWTQGTLPTSRYGESAVWTGSCAYVFGGYDGAYLTDIIKYDPITNTATKMTEALPTGRRYTSAVWTGSYAYVFGGYNGFYLNEIIKYDPATHSVTKMTETLPTGRESTSAVWTGSRVFIFGGTNMGNPVSDIIEYNPSARTVTKMTEALPTARSGTSAVWSGSLAYVFGGAWMSTIIVYDPAAHTVTAMTETLPTVRAYTCAVWTGDAAYVMGGHDGTKYLSDVVKYDPTAHAVTKMTETLPEARAYMAVAWSGDSAYLFGGSPNTNLIIRYMPKRYYLLEESSSGDFTPTVNIFTGFSLTKSVTNKPDGTYYYRVKAAGGEWSNIVNVVVEPSLRISLPKGWNLISIPTLESDWSTTVLFSGILDHVLTIQAYDSESGTWLVFSRGAPDWLNTLDRISPNQGIWVETDSLQMLDMRGDWRIVPIQIDLYKGWNLVGYPSMNSTRTILEVMSGVPVDVVQKSDAGWTYNLRYLLGNEIMKPGAGYWVHVTADCTWTVEC